MLAESAPAAPLAGGAGFVFSTPSREAGAPCARQSAAALANEKTNFSDSRSISVVIQIVSSNTRQENILRFSDGESASEGKYFLAKTDPETYPFEQLEREGETIWDGVRNPQALRAIRDMKSGDRVFIYHSMGDAAIVGVADVVGDGRPDPGNAKLAVADFRFRCRIEPPVTLREIKESGEFDQWSLVRQSRLSTMACAR